MPAFEYKIKQLETLVGEKIENITKFFPSLKLEGEIKGDTILIEFKDVNRPELWTLEVLARELKAKLGKKNWIYDVKRGKWKINIDKSIKGIRPYIAAIVIKDVMIDDQFLKYLIQIQEALAENYGRRRKYVSIGIYDFDRIVWPVKYLAINPTEIKFVPLGMSKKMNLKEILKRHEKGIKYGYLLTGLDKYPILIDAENNVLSFPPIINSEYSGKVEVGKRNLVVEVTGLHEDFVHHTIDILSRIFLERGYGVYSVAIDSKGNVKYYPNFKEKLIKVDPESIDVAFGMHLRKKEILKISKKFLAKVKFNKKYLFVYPSYRYDIKGKDDVIEDLLINYGYDKFTPSIQNLEESTKGSETWEYQKYRRISRIMSSIAEEVLTGILVNPSTFKEKIRKKFKLVTVSNPISQNYSALRNYIFPSHLNFLSFNKSVTLPLKIFEIGKVVRIIDRENNDVNQGSNGEIKEEIHLSYALLGPNVTFTNAKQDLSFLFRSMGIKNWKIDNVEDSTFIVGRVGKILINEEPIGIIGEIHPAVLNSFGIYYPVVIFEIDVSKLN